MDVDCCCTVLGLRQHGTHFAAREQGRVPLFSSSLLSAISVTDSFSSVQYDIRVASFWSVHSLVDSLMHAYVDWLMHTLFGRLRCPFVVSLVDALLYHCTKIVICVPVYYCAVQQGRVVGDALVIRSPRHDAKNKPVRHPLDNPLPPPSPPPRRPPSLPYLRVCGTICVLRDVSESLPCCVWNSDIKDTAVGMVSSKICFCFGCRQVGSIPSVFRVLQGAEHQGLRPPFVLSRNLGHYDTLYHVLVSGMGAGCTIVVFSKRE